VESSQQGNGLASRHSYALKDVIRRRTSISELFPGRECQRHGLTAQFLLPQYDPLGWPPSRPERVQRLSVPTRELRPIVRMSQLHSSQRKRTVVECNSYRRLPWVQYRTGRRVHQSGKSECLARKCDRQVSKCWIGFGRGHYHNPHSFSYHHVSTGTCLGILRLSDAFRGPYYTSWSSGQSRGFATWTGLTEYADQFFPTVTPVYGAAGTDSNGSTMSASSGMSTSSAPSSAASASEQATSAPNSGTVQATSSGILWMVCFVGLVGLL
jgi:hypothetical protein